MVTTLYVLGAVGLFSGPLLWWFSDVLWLGFLLVSLGCSLILMGMARADPRLIDQPDSNTLDSEDIAGAKNYRLEATPPRSVQLPHGHP